MYVTQTIHPQSLVRVRVRVRNRDLEMRLQIVVSAVCLASAFFIYQCV